MSVRSLILPLLAVLWLWPLAANGQSPALNEAYKRAGELYAQGRYQEALPFAEKGARLSERELGLDHTATAATLDNVALDYTVLGRHSEAEPLYRLALSEMEHFV